MNGAAPLGWGGIARLGLVQAAIGAIVMLATSLLNRVMVVEYALPAAVPAGFVAWHYAVQLSRPLWGHGSDRGRRRTGWIVSGMVVLGLGAMTAVAALPLLRAAPAAGFALSIAAFAMIGAGVGAAGTSLLALLAARVAAERRQAAAAVTWTMMIAGIAVTAGIAGSLLDPFTLARLGAVATGIVLAAVLLTVIALWGIEGPPPPCPADRPAGPPFLQAARRSMGEPETRRFTIFVFVSMLAYSMQDLILEPFAGLLFGFTPGQSTSLSGAQHGGALAGMILAGVAGNAFHRLPPRGWIAGGCLGSGAALIGLAIAARLAPAWPLSANVALLGFSNGIFSVSAVGTMIALAGAEGEARAGLRLGIWGAAQAIGFGFGGLFGATAVDVLRVLTGASRDAFFLVFGLEALLFMLAAVLGARAAGRSRAQALHIAEAMA